MSLFFSCSTFLQITMVNSCPLPLLLDNSSLKTDFNITLIGRETNLPKVRGREERGEEKEWSERGYDNVLLGILFW